MGRYEGMVEPWDRAPKDKDLSEDERRLLERLRNRQGEDQVEPVEDRPEVASAVESDTVVDPDVMPPSGPAPEEAGEPRDADESDQAG